MYSAHSSGTSTYSRSSEPIRRTGASVSRPPVSSASARKESVQTEYKPLDKVRHPAWGEGVVLESKIDGGDEIVTIQFQSVGLKKVVAGMTKLVKLSKPIN